jgi:hypothetical protein
MNQSLINTTICNLHKCLGSLKIWNVISPAEKVRISNRIDRLNTTFNQMVDDLTKAAEASEKVTRPKKGKKQ